MYSNVLLLKMYGEGENYIWFINPTNWWDMVKIIDAIGYKLSGQYPTNWWGKVYNMIWNGFDL